MDQQHPELVQQILAKGKATLETVTAIKWWNERLFTFTTTRSPEYQFVAGQYARLGLISEHGPVWRAYSMTSAPADDFLEFYGIVVPGGEFTGCVKNLQAGNRLFVEKQSFGFMTVDRFVDGNDLWMLSTGTGIGPFISMLRDPEVWQKFQNLILVHGVRHADEFAFQDELQRFAAQAPFSSSAKLHVIQTTSREPSVSGSQRLTGRITTLLENGELEKAVDIPLTEQASRIMLCGNPDMIEDTRKLLHQRGMRPVRRALPGQFVTENYW